MQPGLRDLSGWSGGLRCLRYTQRGTGSKVLGGWEEGMLRRCRWDGCNVGRGDMGNLRGAVLMGR